MAKYSYGFTLNKKLGGYKKGKKENEKCKDR